MITTVISLVCGIHAAHAQPIPVRQSDQLNILSHTPPKVYQGQMVISVRTTSQAQLDALLALTESVWTERVGVGMLEVQVRRSNLDAIAKLGIPHEVLIDDLQAHADASWNEIVRLERVRQHNQPNPNRGALVHDDQFFENYQQLNDITSYINNIANLRPDLASTMTIGQSYEGRDMFAISISGPDAPDNLKSDRPVVFIFSNVHAREWIAPMTTTYFASKFVEEYDSDLRVQSLLDQTNIVIVPASNPDGYLYTWSDVRFWRKNRRNNFTGNFGVDINRNWGFEWGGQGSSGSTSSNTYRGTDPFSEPETQALRDLALSFGDQLVAHIDYHSYSQLILWPFGYADGVVTPEPYRTYFDDLARELAGEIRSVHGERYNPIQSIDLYAAAGDSTDWFFGELGVSSLTIELRPDVGGFAPPPSTILPNVQENYHAFKRFVERSIESVSLAHQPMPTTPSATPIELAATAIDRSEEVDPTSATLFVQSCTDCSFEPISMTSLGNSGYAADAPALACGDSANYYFQFSTIQGNTFTLPTEGADAPFTILAEDFVLSYSDTLESDQGWTVGTDSDTATSGVWTRMDPEGTVGQPEDDHTPDGTLCWVTDGNAGTDAQDRDVDGGSTTLTSPVFDGTLPGEVVMSFWYAVKTGVNANFDRLQVELSNDAGQTWKEFVSLTDTNRVWKEWSSSFGSAVEPTDEMRVRFIAYDLFGDHLLEAAVDDFKIEYIGCAISNPADLNEDGVLNFFDVSLFLSAFTNQDPIADFNNDGSWNFFDVSAFVIAFNNG